MFLCCSKKKNKNVAKHSDKIEKKESPPPTTETAAVKAEIRNQTENSTKNQTENGATNLNNQRGLQQTRKSLKDSFNVRDSLSRRSNLVKDAGGYLENRHPDQPSASSAAERIINMHNKTAQKGKKKDIKEKTNNSWVDIALPEKPQVEDKTEETHNFLHHALKNHFIFASMSDDIRHKMIDYMEAKVFAAGYKIILQGEVGDYLFIVESGDIDFFEDGTQVSKCTSGAVFGELALMYSCPRTATAIAATECRVWRLHQKTFRAITVRSTFEEDEQIVELLETIPFLKGISAEVMDEVADSVTKVKFHQGDTIIRKGEIGSIFYIIQSGELSVTDIDGVDREITFGQGKWFGERALFMRETRSATVTAKTDAVLLCLNRDAFEALLGNVIPLLRLCVSQSTSEEASALFAKIPAASSVIEDATFKAGHVLAVQDKPVSKKALYLVREGSVEIKTGDKSILKSVGENFGEESLIMTEGIASAYDAIVKADNTVLGVITQEGFEKLVREITSLEKEDAKDYLNRGIKFEHLEKVKLLGEGAFGKVWLVRDKRTNSAYALKAMNKLQILDIGYEDAIINEKNIMASIKHPFIIDLVNAYQDSRHVYMLLGLLQGGEVFSVIARERGLQYKHAQFYLACVVEAFSYLHSRRIIYRDMKPENLVLDRDGYCVLVDLGMAKRLTEAKTFTFCGTPEYLAPEIIVNSGYNESADCWTLGCLLYEMLFARTIFQLVNDDQMRLFRKIVKAKYKFPNCSFPAECKSLIDSLLVLTASMRPKCFVPEGRYGEDDRSNIKNHRYFEGFEWDKLLEKSMATPWNPKIKDALDASNFDSFVDTSESGGSLPVPTASQQRLFAEFSGI